MNSETKPKQNSVAMDLETTKDRMYRLQNLRIEREEKERRRATALVTNPTAIMEADTAIFMAREARLLASRTKNQEQWKDPSDYSEASLRSLEELRLVRAKSPEPTTSQSSIPSLSELLEDFKQLRMQPKDKSKVARIQKQQKKTSIVQDTEKHSPSSPTSLSKEVPTEISAKGVIFSPASMIEQQIDGESALDAQRDRVRESYCFHKPSKIAKKLDFPIAPRSIFNARCKANQSDLL